MLGSKTISLVIGTYNPNEQGFKEALESSTGLFNEVIVVDDGSDTSVQSNVRHSSNLGFYEARNTGCNLANGEWIASLDDDDRFIPENVEELKKFIEVIDADIVHFPCMLFGEQEGMWGQNANMNEILINNQIPSCSWFKKSVWEKVRFKLPTAEDWDFWARAKKHGFKFAYFPKPIYYHRMRSGSLSSGWLGDKFVEIRNQVIENYNNERI